MSQLQRYYKKAFQDYIYILPGFLIIALIILYPLGRTVFLSFSASDDNLSLTLANYIRVLNGSHFFDMLRTTLVWMILTVIFSFILGFGSATLIDQDFVTHKNVWRSILLLAWITPGVVKAQSWKWLYSYDFGMLNHLLVSLSIVKEPVSWLTDPHIAFMAVVIIQVWSEFPYTMLMVSAGMQTISKDYRDSALLDGVNWFQYLTHIQIPLIKDIIFIAILISTIWAINTFAVIWIVTQGGPARATSVLSLDIYQKFLMFDLRGASATAMLQLCISMLITVFYLSRTNKEGA